MSILQIKSNFSLKLSTLALISVLESKQVKSNVIRQLRK